jgi:hypothetical protein
MLSAPSQHSDAVQIDPSSHIAGALRYNSGNVEVCNSPS